MRSNNIKTFLALILFQLLVAASQSYASKIDCHPLAGATKDKCETLGCIWSPVEGSPQVSKDSDDFGPLADLNSYIKNEQKSRVDEPWCYFPLKYIGYKILSTTQDEIKLQRVRASNLGADIKNLIVRTTPYNENTVLRLQILDADKERFVPELPSLNLKPTTNQKADRDDLEKDGFKIELINLESGQNNSTGDGPHMLLVKRLSTNSVIFATDLTKLIYSDKFIQLNSELGSQFVYGLGEHYDSFLKLADKYKTYSFYNTDRLTLPGGTRSYGGFPFLINLDSVNASHAHGIYLRNSNAMDIVIQNDFSLTFRPIGGILDFFFLMGPTPMDVVSQFQHLVGLPDLPPRWSLGFHLCRYNYKSLARTREIWQRTRDAGIPFDVQWNDIDYMDRGNDFTYDQTNYKRLPEFVDELHRHNMHYMLIFDPGVSQEGNYLPYSIGQQMDIFIKNATNQTLVGKVWNQSGRTVFPDFSNPSSHDYWSEMFTRFHENIKFDGAWIDMNDISNFVDGSIDGCPFESSPLERPPYSPGGYDLQHKSLCLSAQHKAGSEYDVHNLYSFYETIATRKALQAARPNRRSLIISRSTHPGQGHFGGHWSGDVLSTWPYLRWSIPSLLEHSMYGFSMIGTDICGFLGNTTESLCARWSTLGAFYTFSRNHNDDVSIDQDPVALGPVVVSANKNALTKRYSLLPYLYTLIHKAHSRGEPVARSMLFEFFKHIDNKRQVMLAEDQFMWGSAILVSPIVVENLSAKMTYLPEGRWYELDIMPESMSFDLEHVKVPRVINSHTGQANRWHETDNVGLDNLILFYRGGSIIPIYSNVSQTIPETVNQPISLEVALCQFDRANGELILDDGESIEEKIDHIKMKVRNGMLEINLEQDDYMVEVKFGKVKVYGLSIKVSQVKILSSGGKNLTFEQKEHMLMFDLASAKVSKQESLKIEWS